MECSKMLVYIGVSWFSVVNVVFNFCEQTLEIQSYYTPS